MWYDALKKGVQTFCQGPSTDCEPYLPFVFRLSPFVKRNVTQKGVFQLSSSCTNQWMHSGGTPNTNHKGSHPHPMWKLITNLDITQEVLQFSPIQNSIQKRNETEQSVFFTTTVALFVASVWLLLLLLVLLRIAIYFFYQRRLGCLACNYKLRMCINRSFQAL